MRLASNYLKRAKHTKNLINILTLPQVDTMSEKQLPKVTASGLSVVLKVEKKKNLASHKRRAT